MRKLLTWYAQYFNRRHKRTGHLFENRYKSILCDEETYLLALVRYIHLNPLRAQSIGSLEQLDSYAWSGHRVIIGKTNYPWMDVETILGRFGSKRRSSIAEYRRYIQNGLRDGRNPTLTGGGLIRSCGGWSQVQAMRRKGDSQLADERILGSDVFVHTVLKETEERNLRQLKIHRSGRTLEKIIGEECKKAGISPEELHSGSRRSVVSDVRGTIAWRGREELGLPAAEIARFLGVATSSITRAIERMSGRDVMQCK
jgi:hypothetical protein